MQKPVLILGQTSHRETSVLLLNFERNETLLSLLRSSFPHMRWSATLKSWYLPYAPALPSEITHRVQHLAAVDNKTLSRPIPEIQKNVRQIQSKKEHPTNLAPLSEKSSKKTEQFRAWMRSKRYAESTVSTYMDALTIFLRYFNAKPIECISHEDLIEFNNRYILSQQLSSSYQNQMVNAVKLFFKTQHLRSMDIELVHRPKREHVLPNVLSKEEVKRILDSHTNYKHRVMLTLIYACGLRRSELLNLKPLDVASDRGLLLIKQSKGKKDRIVPISENLIKILREYYVMYKPKIWLFEGQVSGEQYSGESLQHVLKQALSKTGISKPVTLHWLRHSYATHLLEKGTDLRYIQELLGHNSSRTTEIYTHVSSKSIQQIKSPFDDL